MGSSQENKELHPGCACVPRKMFNAWLEFAEPRTTSPRMRAACGTCLSGDSEERARPLRFPSRATGCPGPPCGTRQRQLTDIRRNERGSQDTIQSAKGSTHTIEHIFRRAKGSTHTVTQTNKRTLYTICACEPFSLIQPISTHDCPHDDPLGQKFGRIPSRRE